MVNLDDEKTPERTLSPHGHHRGDGHPHAGAGHAHFKLSSLRKLVYPSALGGRILHIAHSPEEHEHFRRTLSHDAGNDNIDVCLHGSDEHVQAIREIHDHHNTRKSTLREQHGDVYDEVEELVTHLGHLQHELHEVTNKTVSLDANFSKYGYDARLRTKDVSSPGTQSPFPSSLAESNQRGRDTAEQLMFWKPPILRQYFHRGLLWRSSSSGEVASFELFVDLVYVGVIAVLGDTAAENPTGRSFLHFAITFLMALKIWTDLTNWVDWFEIDDVVQRLSVVFYLVCLLGFTVNIQNGFEGTYPAMVSWYLAQRFFVALYYVWLSYLLPMTRGTMLYQALVAVIGGSLWIGSIHVEYPSRLGLIWPALIIDHYANSLIAGFTIRSQQHFKQTGDGAAHSRLEEWFSFYPAVNIEHRVERNNAFVTLVLGANILSIIFQLKSADPPLSAFFGKAILVLLQAFSINWIYFDIDGSNLHQHAIRRHAISMFSWMFMHVTFIMGLILSSGAMAILVIAHDCSNADPEILGEAYVDKSEGELSAGLRWFYSAGLGAAVLSMAGIAWSHEHRTLKGAHISKLTRLLFRCSVGVVLICLPLAEELTSLGLMATTCCLIILILIVDIFGAHCTKGESFWLGGLCEKQRNRCKYTCPNRKNSEGGTLIDSGEAGKDGKSRVTNHAISV